MKNLYNLVMSSDSNPLADLPNMVKFQLMTILSFMWSIIFTFIIGSYLVFGPTMIAHILFLIGIYFTSDIFKKSLES